MTAEEQTAGGTITAEQGVPRSGAIDLARSGSIGELLRRTATRSPGKLAMAHGETRRTFAEMNAEVNRVAQAVAATGVTKGDRVAILSHNSYEFVAAYFALAKIGVISVPINFMLDSSDVAYVLEHAQVRAVIAEASLCPTMEGALSAIPAIADGLAFRATVGESRDGWTPFADLSTGGSDVEPEVVVFDDDPIQIIYTSGTESRPKGAVLTSRCLIAQYASVALGGGMREDDVEIHALPLYHCAALHCFLTPDVWLGATSIILDGPNPDLILAAIERERATKLFCPPTVWIGLLRSKAFDTADLTSLTKGYYGAAPMPVEVLAELQERLPNVAFYNFYGQTEMSPAVSILEPQDQVRKAGSAGRTVIGVETRIVDDSDNPLPAGEVGEIVHRGSQTMLAYWNDEAKTAEAFRGGWFHSGDLGVFDDEGYLSIVDRKKDMINTGGENVASREVEEAIYMHPAVSEVAVFAAPHDYWVEAVVATVVLKEGASLEEEGLLAFCRENLSAYKVPKAVAFVTSLPKNPSGKILKKTLREQHSALANGR
jgi:fatty-acyl-CoA synthase